jgi:hypothetical protein
MARAGLAAPVAPAASVAETVVLAVRVEHRVHLHCGAKVAQVAPVA